MLRSHSLRRLEVGVAMGVLAQQLALTAVVQARVPLAARPTVVVVEEVVADASYARNCIVRGLWLSASGVQTRRSVGSSGCLTLT